MEEDVVGKLTMAELMKEIDEVKTRRFRVRQEQTRLSNEDNDLLKALTMYRAEFQRRSDKVLE
jgi:hypothetical protein